MDEPESFKERNEMSSEKPSIVFVHGLWADGSCFNKVAAPLIAEGYEVLSSQHSLDTLEGDVSMVTQTLEKASGPVLLVGHSYGGTLITAAGIHEKVAGLVYIAALAPDEEETSQSQQEKFPTTEIFQHIDLVAGRFWIADGGISCFCGDLPEDEQKLVQATQLSAAAPLFTEKIDGTAWRTKPSHYILAKNDQTVHPDLERTAAERMGATVTELESSHVPMVSQPDAVLEVVKAAAAAI
jgi:pimeloyl-ACP methyl ester carboxylesterase